MSHQRLISGEVRQARLTLRRKRCGAVAAVMFSLIAGALVGTAPALAAAPTLYVSSTAASDPACASASPTNPFATIAGALTCASNGSTIKVGAGTFAGGFTIARNVVLQGSGAGTVIADPSAPVQSVTEVTIAGGRLVTLKNLTVDGGGRQRDVIAGSGSLTVVNSTITGGVSENAGGISVEPGPGTTAKLTVLRSTIANNLGLGGASGGINVGNAPGPSARNTASIIDSTITGNQAGTTGGGIRIGSFVSLSVRDSTIARNDGPQGGGGLWVRGTGTGGLVVSPVTLTNTILAANTTAWGPNDCQDPQGVTDGGHNLLGVLDANCPGIVGGANGNQAGTAASPLDPHLGALAANGGPTQTLALLSGSPAINAANLSDCQAPPVGGTDQRGVNRNAATRLACDTGAYDTRGRPFQTLYVRRAAASDPACASASPTNPFRTIAGALTCASDGSTINVGIGTFAGGFTITHNIVLTGNGPGTVIADPSAPVQSVTEVTIAGGHFVTLKNLTVDGSAVQRDVAAGSGSLTVVNSTITRGASEGAGGISVEPGTAATAKLTVLRSTIANNLGLGGAPGGINIPDAPSASARNTASIIDSTITGNQAASTGGGIRIGYFDSLNIRDSTIARNDAPQGGGGLWVRGTGPGGLVVSPVTLTNTILAANTTAWGPNDCQDPQGVTDGGHNLLGVLDATCPGIVGGANGNQAGTAASPLDAHLGALAANGGPTQTLALLAGSPAINAGDPSDCQAPPVGGTDQRGVNRNAATRLACDTGAYDTGG